MVTSTATLRPLRRAAADGWVVPAAVAAVAGVLYLVPGIAGAFGPFIDEHYYVACARRLAWGYVDHPPLGPALLRAGMAIGGESLFVLRLLAASFGAATVLGTGLLAARLGAGRWGQGLASAAMLATPIAQVIFGFYSMNAIEPLLWLALCWIAIELALGAPPRLWLAFGAVAGLAMLNKHTVVTLIAALVLGVLITPMRRQLGTVWPWLGAAIAAAMIVPHVAWQVHNGWPSLEFYRNAALYKNQPAGPLQVIGQQLLFIGPGTVPVWAAGLVFLWRHPGARLRLIAAAYGALLLTLIVSQQSRPDRMLGLYPVLFAAGGVALERLAASRRWIRIAAPAWLALTALILLPIGIPVLPPDATAAYGQTLGAVPQLERGEGKRSALPQWFADRLGWQELVDEVAAIRDALPPDERREVAIFGPSYGQAGALEWLGEDRGLRPAYSTHNTYFLWGPPPGNPQVAIVIGDRRERLAELFAEVELARIHDCDRCTPWRDDMPIWIVRGPKTPIAERWAGWKHFE
jgi:hypothetical protein